MAGHRSSLDPAIRRRSVCTPVGAAPPQQPRARDPSSVGPHWHACRCRAYSNVAQLPNGRPNGSVLKSPYHYLILTASLQVMLLRA